MAGRQKGNVQRNVVCEGKVKGYSCFFVATASSAACCHYFSYFMTLPRTVVVVGQGVRVHGGGGEGEGVVLVRITVAMDGSHGDGRCG